MSKKFKQLYAQSSTGKTKTWMIEAIGKTMVEKWGYLGGKMQEQRKTVTGVNTGKANATTDEQQCEAECLSKWNHKKDQEYVEELGKVKASSEQKTLLPMLALRFEERKGDITFPCYVQPKLNGCRCTVQDGKFISRQGKEFTTLDHLTPELRKLKMAIPDGELYIHGETFQEIIRRVKKDRGTKSEELQFWIYDQITDNDFADRTKDIAAQFKLYKPGPCLVQVPTYEVKSEEEINLFHNKFIQEGYEGIIIRNKLGAYQPKHRSKNLQKLKMFQDSEFKITGGHEGSANDKGTVVFECVTSSGVTFSVRPRGTVEQRTAWLKDLKNLIGKSLTVRYQNLSESGAPIFPVGVSVEASVRDYE